MPRHARCVISGRYRVRYGAKPRSAFGSLQILAGPPRAPRACDRSPLAPPAGETIAGRIDEAAPEQARHLLRGAHSQRHQQPSLEGDAVARADPGLVRIAVA